MPEPDFVSLLGVTAIAFAAPLLLAFVPRLAVPAVVVELVAGIVAGPQVVGLLDVDAPVAVVSLLGLAMLLFLAGLEIDLDRLRGAALRTVAIGFAASFALALAIGVALALTGVVRNAVFVAIALSSTSLGVAVPVLKDAGLLERPFGQLVIASASVADVVTIVLLSLLFSSESASTAAQAALLGGLLLFAVVVATGVRFARHFAFVGAAVGRLTGTTAEIRVRFAVLLLVAFVAAAQAAGLEVILGAFVAGVVLNAVDPMGTIRHPAFRAKLQAVGFGLLIPVFFVASGLRYDLRALLDHPSTALRVPVLLLCLLAARGLPARLFRSQLDRPGDWRAAALLQATTLPFLVAATQIGLELDLLSPATAAALVAAGLLSVVLFPAAALTLLRSPAGSPA